MKPTKSPSGEDVTFVCSARRAARPGFNDSNLWVAASTALEVVGLTSLKWKPESREMLGWPELLMMFLSLRLGGLRGQFVENEITKSAIDIIMLKGKKGKCLSLFRRTCFK
jgi:hypothetical protein